MSVLQSALKVRTSLDAAAGQQIYANLDSEILLAMMEIYADLVKDYRYRAVTFEESANQMQHTIGLLQKELKKRKNKK